MDTGLRRVKCWRLMYRDEKGVEYWITDEPWIWECFLADWDRGAKPVDFPTREAAQTWVTERLAFLRRHSDDATSQRRSDYVLVKVTVPDWRARVALAVLTLGDELVSCHHDVQQTPVRCERLRDALRQLGAPPP